MHLSNDMRKLKTLAVSFFICGILAAFFSAIAYQAYLAAAFQPPISGYRHSHCLLCITDHATASAYGFVLASVLVFSGMFTLKIDSMRGRNVIAA